MAFNIFLLVVGFLLLIKGADVLVDGASNIAKKFNIPEIVIGLTIVSIGTSMPEMIVSTASAISGHSDMSVGNIVGSNLVNLLFILGICAIIKPLIFKKETKFIENFIALFVTILLKRFQIKCRYSIIIYDFIHRRSFDEEIIFYNCAYSCTFRICI